MTEPVLAPFTDDMPEPWWDPQAIFTLPIESFVRPDHPETAGEDGLDAYRAIAGTVDGTPFTIRAYRGFPPRTVELYFSHAITDEAQIRALVARAMQAFAIPAAELAWQRGDTIGDHSAWLERLRNRPAA